MKTHTYISSSLVNLFFKRQIKRNLLKKYDCDSWMQPKIFTIIHIVLD
jgi:hypothetical protein